MKDSEWKHYIDKLNNATNKIRLDGIIFRIELNQTFNPNRYIFASDLVEDEATRCKNLVLHKFVNINYLGETRKEVYKSFYNR